MASDLNDEAALRALFADAPRPPMGDERFVRGVMGRVGAAQEKREGRWRLLSLAALGGTAGLAWVHADLVTAQLGSAWAGQVSLAAQVSPALLALVVAAGAAALSVLVAER